MATTFFGFHQSGASKARPSEQQSTALLDLSCSRLTILLCAMRSTRRVQEHSNRSIQHYQTHFASGWTRFRQISADRHRGQRVREIPQTPRSTTRLEVGLLRDVVDVYVNGFMKVPSYPCFKPPAFEWRGLDPLVLLFQLSSTFNPFCSPPVLLRYGSTPWFLPRRCSHSAAICEACHQALFVLSTRPTSTSSPAFPPSLPRPTLPI